MQKLTGPDPPPCLNGVINHYSPVLGFGCDSSALQVGTLSGFSEGDKVLIIQMQVPQVDLSNTAAFGSLLNTTCVGNYEFNRILSQSGNTMQLKYQLTRPYDLNGKVQVVRVPEYDTAGVCNITCQPWNGTTGGVLALDVKTQLTLNGNIDVSGRGFRGGIVETNFIDWLFAEQQYFYPPQSTYAAQKGEGLVMIPTDHSYGRGRAGNGGGGGNAHNAGGGGGGNAGAGGEGGGEITNLPASPTPNTNGIGGNKYFDTDFNKVILGGGAGAGHANDSRGSSGGNGGGIIFITANSIQSNNFHLIANGIDVYGGAEENDGQGGGGAGGTVVLKVAQVTGSLICELRGGEGGSNPYTPNFQLHGPGGGGGGGKLLVTQNLPNITGDIQGGVNGLTSQNFTNGATPGLFGKVLTGFTLPEGTTLAHPVSDNMLLDVISPACASSTGQISILQSSAIAFRLNGGSWQPDSIFTGLTPGNYNIQLQFSGGCTIDTNAVILPAALIADTLLLLNNATCASGGELLVADVSGSPPFEFQLNNGPWQPDGAFTNLAAGTYTVTMRDSKGCTVSDTYTINAPPPVQEILLGLQHATCVSGGNINVQAQGGKPPFQYQLNSDPWQIAGSFTDLAPGQYTVTVRDANSCTTSNSYTINAAPPVQQTLLGVTHTTCVLNGSISVAGFAGTPPYRFSLNNGPLQLSGTFSNLTASNYTVTVQDDAGCTNSATYTVDSPSELRDSLLVQQDATCILGGRLEVAALSGTAPVEFRLNSGLWQSNGTFPNLMPGIYTVTIRDASGCSTSKLYTIGTPPAPADTIVNLQHATCVTGGGIVVEAIAGTAPFQFQINNGLWQNSTTFSNLVPGDYILSVRDAAGCTVQDSFHIKAPPPGRDTLLSLKHTPCVGGGSLLLQAQSGTAPFEFQLNGGVWQSAGLFGDLIPGVYTVTMRDAAGCTDSGTYTIGHTPPAKDTLFLMEQATCLEGGALIFGTTSGTAPFEFQLNNGIWKPIGIFTNLPPDTYNLVLRDAAGCTHTSSHVIHEPPPARDTLLSIKDATCLVGGSMTFGAVSGTSPYEFRLDTGIWRSFGTFTDLPPGTYTVTMRDAAGCTYTDTYSIAAPPAIEDTLLQLQNATCVLGGTVLLDAVSGTAPFEFRLDSLAWQFGGMFTNLEPGDYKVHFRDAAGCAGIDSFTIIGAPPANAILITQINPTCVTKGAFVLQATAGTPPFEFQLNTGNWQPSGTFSGLSAGSYTVNLRDSAGCTHSGSYVLTSPPPVRDSLVSLREIHCDSLGSALIQAVSGTPPFQYQLNNGALQSSGSFVELSSGVYNVTIRDAAGCTANTSFNIAAGQPLRLLLDSASIVDCRHREAFVRLSATGGAKPYSFQLENVLPTQSTGYFTGLDAGVYSFQITDADGCSTTQEVEITTRIDTVLTRETVTIYEGSYYLMPDGSRKAREGEYPFAFKSEEGCDSLHIIDLVVLKRHIYVPNVFSPDGDGQNDYFTIFSDASLEKISQLLVFDRWGELLFEKSDFLPNLEEIGWDGVYRGRAVNPGAFVWMAKLAFVDGVQLTLKGDVTVVR